MDVSLWDWLSTGCVSDEERWIADVSSLEWSSRPSASAEWHVAACGMMAEEGETMIPYLLKIQPITHTHHHRQTARE
eukprot:scaffold248532_cov67-Cyclotella_meneghiniana.AAC.2